MQRVLLQVDLLHAPAESLKAFKRLRVDTVVMNPPFGTRQKGADIEFLNIALQVSSHASQVGCLRMCPRIRLEPCKDDIHQCQPCSWCRMLQTNVHNALCFEHSLQPAQAAAVQSALAFATGLRWCVYRRAWP